MNSPTTDAGLHLIDTSALSRVRHPAVHDVVTHLIAEGHAATCVTVDLQAGYSGRDEQEVRTIRTGRPLRYRVLEISEAIADRARDVQVRMAAHGLHRAAGIVDLLTAAVAEHHGAVIVHYDADFEHIAAVTGQAHRWVVRRGSVD